MIFHISNRDMAPPLYGFSCASSDVMTEEKIFHTGYRKFCKWNWIPMLMPLNKLNIVQKSRQTVQFYNIPNLESIEKFNKQSEKNKP